jgi:hypothetical protein
MESRCHYTLLLPAPTRLSCAGGTGMLTLPPVVPASDTSTSAASTVTELDGKSFRVAVHTPLMPVPDSTIVPSSISYSEATTNGPPARIKLLFSATPVSVMPGQAVTEWTLSDVSVLYRPSGAADEKQLLCATGGSYSISASEPVAHAVTLTGLSGPVACPGAPVTTPVAVLLER